MWLSERPPTNHGGRLHRQKRFRHYQTFITAYFCPSWIVKVDLSTSTSYHVILLMRLRILCSYLFYCDYFFIFYIYTRVMIMINFTCFKHVFNRLILTGIPMHMLYCLQQRFSFILRIHIHAYSLVCSCRSITYSYELLFS
jgi:hypothetical protein